VDAVSFSPDGKRLITVTRGERTRIWDVETGRELLTFSYASNQYAFARFSPCGRMVALTEGHNAVIIPSFPWKEEDYPGDETMSLEDRIELYKREFWEQPARRSESARDLLAIPRTPRKRR
jgi:WD40 repeat protein